MLEHILPNGACLYLTLPALCWLTEDPLVWELGTLHDSMYMYHIMHGTAGRCSLAVTSSHFFPVFYPSSPFPNSPISSLLSPDNRKLPRFCSPTPHVATSAARTLSQGAATLPVCEPDRGNPVASLGSSVSGARRCHGRPLKVAWDRAGMCRAGRSGWEARPFL